MMREQQVGGGLQCTKIEKDKGTTKITLEHMHARHDNEIQRCRERDKRENTTRHQATTAGGL